MPCSTARDRPGRDRRSRGPRAWATTRRSSAAERTEPDGWHRAGDRLTGGPDGWIGFKEAKVIHYLDNDFLQFELKPDGPADPLRPAVHHQCLRHARRPGHAREARRDLPHRRAGRVDGHGLGRDVPGHLRQPAARLADDCAAEPGLGHPRRFEVLNFAVAAYSPLQRLETLRRKVLAFRPDLVIYSATTLDVRLTEIHLCDMLRKRRRLAVRLREGDDRRGEGLGQGPAGRRATGDLIHKDRLKAKLRPYLLGPLRPDAGPARGRVPVGGRAAGDGDHPSGRVGRLAGARAEPVARLKALAAHQGVTVFDLSDTFDPYDPATLEIAAWDDHPNAMGHQRLFQALARAVAADATLSRRLFPMGRLFPGTGTAGPAEPWAGDETGSVPPEGLRRRRRGRSS